MKKLLLTVGNGWMGDDGAGAFLAQLLQKKPVDGWIALDGGAMPENVLHTVRDQAPDQVLLVDACDMDLPTGSIRRIPLERLENTFLFTTHSLPLCFLVEALMEFTPRVEMLGIQPGVVAFGMPMSPEVRAAVDEVYLGLINEKVDWTTLEEPDGF
jgi:hydrogenase 3 maturation protease